MVHVTALCDWACPVLLIVRVTVPVVVARPSLSLGLLGPDSCCVVWMKHKITRFSFAGGNGTSFEIPSACIHITTGTHSSVVERHDVQCRGRLLQHACVEYLGRMAEFDERRRRLCALMLPPLNDMPRSCVPTHTHTHNYAFIIIAMSQTRTHQRMHPHCEISITAPTVSVSIVRMYGHIRTRASTRLYRHTRMTSHVHTHLRNIAFILF